MHCSYCKNGGHNKTSCKQRKADLKLQKQPMQQMATSSIVDSEELVITRVIFILILLVYLFISTNYEF